MALFSVPVIGSPGRWYTIFETTTNAEGSGWGLYGLRAIFPAALFTSPPASATKIRVTASAVGSSASMNFGGIVVGHQAASGDVYDFDGAQAATNFSGLGPATVTAGSVLLSDDTVFAFDPAKALVVAIGFSATSSVGRKDGLNAGFIHYDKPSGSSDVATTDVTGYSANNAGRVDGISKIEVFK